MGRLPAARTEASQRDSLMQASFLLRLRKAFSNKKGFLQRFPDKGSFFIRGAPSKKNIGFTESFLDAGPLFIKEGLQQQERLLAEIPRQRLLFYRGRPPATRTEASQRHSLIQDPFLLRKAFSNKSCFLERFLGKGSFFTWEGPQQQEQRLHREIP